MDFKTNTRQFFILIIGCCIFACSTPKQEESTEEAAAEDRDTPSAITISKVTGSPEYADASLTMNFPSDTPLDTGAIAFDFKVENYELGAQTSDASTKGLANSGKGQHIHLIVDNGPYSAHYDAQFEKSLDEGSHVILAFLSRSYHESVKNANAFVVKQVTVGNPAEVEEVDFTAPHMFYSRPKGTYSGADTEKLLLDFYLLNVTLSEDGYKVRATINGEEFMINEWAPYQVEGLPLGEVTVKLELLDAAGSNVAGPFNTVERTVTLTE
ncbi:MAG: hypothetical protein AAF843_17980 [Bacteroidota bacterium]